MQKESKTTILITTIVAILIEIIVLYNCYNDAFNNSPYLQIPSLASLFLVPLFYILLITHSEKSCLLQSIGLTSGCLFMYAIFYLVSYDEEAINNKQDINQKLIIVPAILKNKPVLDENNNPESSTSDYLDFYFSNLPTFRYRFEYNYNHRQYDEELRYQTEIGDTVYIEIPKREYEIKIAKTKQPTFKEKHFDWNDIYIIGVSNRNFKVGCKYCYDEEMEKLK